MRCCFAPMEGITGKRYREVHAAFFPGVNRYCLPFLTPTEAHRLTPQQIRELDPGPLDRARLLPQVLTKSADDFVWFASVLAELGYSEVNLNLGCPSGTVVSKGKGAGLLRDPDALRRFLDEIFLRSPLPISVKTRIGLESESEFGPILALLCAYPLRELCIHPRTRRELYTGGVHLSAFAMAAEAAPFPLCYNGNLFTPASVQQIGEAFPGLPSVMLGRGLLADPALVVRCRGGSRSRETLLAFHEALSGRCLADLHPNQAVLPKFKELWLWLSLLFPDDGTWKRMKKCRTWTEFYPLTQRLLRDAPMLPEADFSRLGQSAVQPSECIQTIGGS